MIEKIKNSPLNSQASSVYNFNEFSLTELLNRFFSTINQCVDSTNTSLQFLSWLKSEGLPLETEKELNKMYEDGRLTNVINELSGNLNNKITEINTELQQVSNNTNENIAQFNTQINDLQKQSNIIKFPTDSRVYLHRGAMQISPENSISSLIESLNVNIPFCEIDVRCSSDNVLVLHHDVTVDRTTNGNGNVNSMTLSQLKSLIIDNGNNIDLYNNEKIPTLEEVLEIARKENIKLMIHLYDLGNYGTTEMVVRNFYNLLEKTQMTNNVICSGNNVYWYFYELRKLNKNIPFSYVVSVFNEDDFTRVKELFPCYYGIIGNPTKEQVDICHLNGIPIICDNVINLQTYQNMMNNNVDIVLSDIIVGGKS